MKETSHARHHVGRRARGEHGRFLLVERFSIKECDWISVLLSVITLLAMNTFIIMKDKLNCCKSSVINYTETYKSN